MSGRHTQVLRPATRARRADRAERPDAPARTRSRTSRPRRERPKRHHLRPGWNRWRQRPSTDLRRPWGYRRPAPLCVAARAAACPRRPELSHDRRPEEDRSTGDESAGQGRPAEHPVHRSDGSQDRGDLLRPADVTRAIDSVRKPALRSAGPSGSGTAPPGTGPERSGSSAAPAPGARHARRMPRPIAVPYRVRSRPHGLRTRAGRVPRRAGARSPGCANVGRDDGRSKARTTRQAVDGPSRTARW